MYVVQLSSLNLFVDVYSLWRVLPDFLVAKPLDYCYFNETNYL